VTGIVDETGGTGATVSSASRGATGIVFETGGTGAGGGAPVPGAAGCFAEIGAMPTPIIVRLRLIRGAGGGAFAGAIGGAGAGATGAGGGAAATGGATTGGGAPVPGAVPPRAGSICVVSDGSGGTGSGTGALRSAISRLWTARLASSISSNATRIMTRLTAGLRELTGVGFASVTRQRPRIATD
jgi:hypothetical protein